LCEPAATNLFLNSATPVTQNITTTAQAYTFSVVGTGSVTLTGTATGVATQGSPLTVTATAGALTCTVAGTLSYAQVEAGSGKTSPIPTTAAVTRQASQITVPVASVLPASGNDFWMLIEGEVSYKSGLNSVLFHAYDGVDNGVSELKIYLSDTGALTAKIRLNSVSYYKGRASGLVSGVPKFVRFIIAKSSITGFRLYSGVDTINADNALTGGLIGFTGNARLGSTITNTEHELGTISLKSFPGQITDANMIALTAGTKTLAEVVG
jgi:hypothetical protein